MNEYEEFFVELDGLLTDLGIIPPEKGSYIGDCKHYITRAREKVAFLLKTVEELDK